MIFLVAACVWFALVWSTLVWAIAYDRGWYRGFEDCKKIHDRMS